MKVENYISRNDKYLTQSYFPIQDKVTFISFWLEANARLKSSNLVIGMWKAKCVHDWKNNITEQYQECRNCGIGHAL